MDLDLTAIIVAAIGGGALKTVLDYAFGGKKKVSLDVMQTELSRMDTRVARLEHQLERYEMRESIFSSATSCAHKCVVPDENCPVLSYLDKNPLPEKSID